jgi:hypothetical protein
MKRAFKCSAGDQLLAAFTPESTTLVLSNRPGIVQLTELELEAYIDWLDGALDAIAGEEFLFTEDFDVSYDSVRKAQVDVRLALH